jgi:hypothetical protein
VAESKSVLTQIKNFSGVKVHRCPKYIAINGHGTQDGKRAIIDGNIRHAILGYDEELDFSQSVVEIPNKS